LGIQRNNDIIDFELGTKITGAGFPVYKGKATTCFNQLFLDKNTKLYRILSTAFVTEVLHGTANY
jgi:seryl-tRNA synthetase